MISELVADMMYAEGTRRHNDLGGPVEHHDKVEDDADAIAERLATALIDRSLSVAVAESLTGGRIASRLAAAPSSSEWFAGGVVCYWTDVKHRVLNVPEGPVISEQAVTAMARHVATLMGTDTAVAASGAGGPERQEGQEPGTTWIAACVRDEVVTELHHFDGEPLDVLARTEERVLLLLERELDRIRWE